MRLSRRVPKRLLPDHLRWDGLRDYLQLVSWVDSRVMFGRAKLNRLAIRVTGIFQWIERYADGVERAVTSRHTRSVCLSPVGFVRRWHDVPLVVTSAPGIVADWLLDQGHEDTPIYRFLMWCHWELWG